jgi:hypothetical protein
VNRFTGTIFVPPLIATALFVLGSYGAQWIGEWNWTIDAITGTTVLTGPLTAAMGAHLALGQRRLAPLSDSAPNGWQVPYRVALQAWLLSSAVYVGVGLCALVATTLSAHGGPFTWWALLIGFPVLGVGAGIGVAAGHWWPYRITVLLVAPLMFLFGAFGPYPAADLLRHGPESGSLAGLAFDPTVWWAQTAALVATIGCLGVAVLPWRGRDSGPRLILAAGGCLITLLVTLWLADHAGTERFVASNERPTACKGTQPEVCLAPSNRTNLEATATGMATATAVLAAAGIDVPVTYEQLLPGYQPPLNVGMITRLLGPDDADDLRAAAGNLLIPSACPAWTDSNKPPPGPVFDAQTLITEWMVMQDGGTPSPFSAESQKWLRAEQGKGSNGWVTTTFTALSDCELDAVKLPWGSASP